MNSQTGEAIDLYNKALFDMQNAYRNHLMIKVNGFDSMQISISDLMSFYDKNGVRSDYNVKYLNITQYLKMTNEKLFEIYQIHEWLANNMANENVHDIRTYLLQRYFKDGKELIHDIKWAIDQMINWTYLLSGDTKNVDSIGKWLGANKNSSKTGMYYSRYRPFFKKINLMDNAAKHHFILDMQQTFNFDEPHVTVLHCEDYRKIQEVKPIDMTVRDLIDTFNSFYEDANRELEKISKSTV